jgi:hypothetical protein
MKQLLIICLSVLVLGTHDAKKTPTQPTQLDRGRSDDAKFFGYRESWGGDRMHILPCCCGASGRGDRSVGLGS